jgi:Fe-S oxidoreductase
MEGDPEILVTACPLCKKTFAKHSPVEVVDIAELVMEAIPTGGQADKRTSGQVSEVVNW